MVSLIVTKNDLLSPWVISCCMFILSAIFVIPNIASWQVNLSPTTIVVISLGLFSFGFGEMSVRILYRKQLLYNKLYSQYIKQENKFRDPINVHTSILLTSIIFMSLVTFFYYKQVLGLAYSVGYSPSSNLPMLRFARIATTTNLVDSNLTNKFLGQCVIISFSYSYLMIYILSYNIIFCKFNKKYILYIIPILIYIIQVILTGGRTQFIYLVSSFFLISIILYQIKTGWKNNVNYKYIRLGFFTFVIMLIIFYFLGSYTGKTAKLNLFETISIYTGSSIVAFDKFLQSKPVGTSALFGENTLFGIYEILHRFDRDFPNLIKQAEFIGFGEYQTNIYTSYMRYIKDFSILGFVLIEIFLGSLYSLMYLKLKIRNRPSVRIIVYAIIFQTILECSIEERFFMNVISIGYLFRISYLVILYIWLVKPQYKYKEAQQVKDYNLS